MFILKGFTPDGIKTLIWMVFILLTSPVAAHAIARAACRSGVKPCAATVVDRYGPAVEQEKRQE